MEGTGEALWYVAAYAQCVGVVALLGGLPIAILDQMVRDKVRESGITTPTAGQEPTEPSASANS